MNSLKSFFGGLWRNFCFGVRTSYLASRKYFFLKCLVLLSTTAIPLTTIWLWKEILNGIIDTNKAVGTVSLCLSAYLLLTLASYLLARFDEYINKKYSRQVEFYIESMMIEKTSRMDLSFFDSASMGDKVRNARENFYVIQQAAWIVFDILSEVVNIVSALVIICAYRWWIGLVILVSLIPYMAYNKWHMDKRLKMEKEQARDNRRMDYYNEVFFDNTVQFEMKLNHTSGYFMERHREIWNRLYRINKREDIRHNIVNTGILVLNISGELLALMVSAIDVATGGIGIGGLQYNLSMAARLRKQASALIEDIERFLVNDKRLRDLQEFINMRPETERSGRKMPSQNPRIEFCGVSFRYPNCGQYVLRNCSFTIEPHEKIGLIGLNGAGKSTVIKLMFRFYDPEEGCIRIDGTDLREYDVYAVRKVFGVLFQDYVTYSLPLREIIALSDFGRRFDDKRLRRACDMSGISETIKDWEAGFDSVLGRYYEDDGKDLSGGQWQLVGLARAYFKESEYMVLDEPSAALDPISEDRIFEQMYHLSAGKSSVTISHRLLNTTLADKILVIGDGHIIEQGSHRELLKKDGVYAHLFRLQASKYV